MFEVHITTAPSPDLAKVADLLGLKLTTIVLARGSHPVQPMLSARWSGSVDQAQDKLGQTTKTLAAHGIQTVRTKLEIDAKDPMAPQDFGPCPLYFEQHIKLDLPDESLKPLLSLVTSFGAHLSKNARHVDPNGRTQRFVTSRSSVGWAATKTRFQQLIDALLGYHIISIEQEYVIYDSRQDLDAQWL